MFFLIFDMHVTGFTFIRNAVIYDYPVIEAIMSILPLCDDFVVAVGNSDDDTSGLIKSIDSSKIRIIETIWDDTLREGGLVLAKETDKAFQDIGASSDWCFYIQGDEVVHEKYHDIIRNKMLLWKDVPEVDGLLFKYLHFYGSYDYIATSSGWYKNEIRIIRNNKNIYSYRDAQGFRKDKDKMLKVKPIDAYIYHYGWVKPPVNMQLKQRTFQKLWHNDDWVDKNVAKTETFDYSGSDQLELFNDTHPA
ncbi:MAG: glycosyltransferase family 2 protein, partial [Saprospiraceae bacterium]|nr:glycosyltransferase family 2 protein [Saprospiraceae bacterium]